MKRVSLLIGFTFLLCGLVTAQEVDDNDVYYSIDYKQKAPEYPVVTEIDTVLPGKRITFSWDPVRGTMSEQDSLDYINTLWDKTSGWISLSQEAVKWQPQLPLSENSVVFADTLQLVPGNYYTFRIWSYIFYPNNTVELKWSQSLIPSSEVGVYLGFKDGTDRPQIPVMYEILIEQ